VAATVGVCGAALVRADDGQDEPPRQRQAGVTAVYEDATGGRIVRWEPLPRLFAEPGHAPHPSLRSEQFSARWTGFLQAPHSGEFVFSADQQNVASVAFELGGRKVDWGEPVSLSFGPVPFRLQVKAGGGAQLALRWQSDQFSLEPIAPAAWSRPDKTPYTDEQFAQQARIDQGAVLADLYGCVRCHASSGGWQQTLGADLTVAERLPGPSLRQAGRRLHRAWVESWLRDPQAFRPHTTMPAAANLGDRAVRVLSTYLTSGQTAAAARAEPQGNVSRGKDLYRSLGCAACHVEKAEAAANRPTPIPTHAHLAEKWTVAGLTEFLQHPLHQRPHGRMPDFSLSTKQAADVAAYLLTRSEAGEAPQFEEPDQPKQPLPELELRPQVTYHYNEDKFPPVEAKFVRFTIEATSDGNAPGIDELEIYGPDRTRNLAKSGKATASSVISGYRIHQVQHLNDGRVGNAHSWISGTPGTGWAQIELPQSQQVQRVVWARERNKKVADRLATQYRIEVSVDGRSWKLVSDHRDRQPLGKGTVSYATLAEAEARHFSLAELQAEWRKLGQPAASFDSLKPGQRLEAVAMGLLLRHGCTNCHATSADGPAGIERPAHGPATHRLDVASYGGPPLPQIAAQAKGSAGNISGGCLATDSAARGAAPKFHFSLERRAALKAFLASDHTGSVPSLAERVRIDMAALNCTACHRNDGAGGEALTQLLGGPEAARWISPPDLSGVAARLRPERLLKFVTAGAGQQRLRPWVGAQMPGFGNRGTRVAQGLFARDAVSGPKPPEANPRNLKTHEPTVAESQIELGRFLVSRKGLSCTNCHRLNRSHLSGPVDPTTRGPDLAQVAEHLRRDYFVRLLNDPARIFPGTKMPRMFGPDGRVPLPALKDLPPRLPVDALWNYLSLGTAAPAPIEEQRVARLPSLLEPMVQRGLTYLDGKPIPRGVSLGFPEGTVLYDADRLRPIALWFGGFLTSREEHYFGLDWRPSVDQVHRLPEGVHRPQFQLPGQQQPQAAGLPLKTDRNDGSRFDGYTVGARSVTLRYRLLVGGQQIPVEERAWLARREDWRGLMRELTLSELPQGTRLHFELGENAVLALDGASPVTESRSQFAQPLVLEAGADRYHAARWAGASGEPWTLGKSNEGRIRLTSAAVGSDGRLQFRIDWWLDQPGAARPKEKELALLAHPQMLSPPAAEKQEASSDNSPVARDGTPTAADRPAEPFTYRIVPIPGPTDTWRPNGIAFDSQGRLYAAAMTQSKIYRTSRPIQAGLPTAGGWQLYASGLHQPIGMAMVDDRLFVSHKPEVSELVDDDGDGQVETFRTVMGGWGLSHGLHEYTFGLAVDQKKSLYVALNTGNFWTHPGAYCFPGRYRGSVMKVDRQGHISEVARGCRVPNGITRGPDGEIFFCDNQGDWIQVCKIMHLEPGRFYGHPEKREDALPAGEYPDGKAACWLPYQFARSASGPVHIDSGGRFGPFEGQMIIGDVGYGANPGVMRVALEKVDGRYQGACFRFLTDQPRGAGRMKVGPDGHLYIGALTTGLARVEYGGRQPMEIHHVNIRPGGKGFVLHFTRPLTADVEPQREIRARSWNYIYSGNYGSPRENEQDVPIEKAEVSADRRSVTLSLPVEPHPIGRVYYFHVGKLAAEDGQAVAHPEAWYTVNWIPGS